ncbi:MAG TPA: hypothetical protein DCP91_04205 [Eggerthellaceae bacterium]|nr:hypothetical protein [Eggerthellaceae bacterium]
MPVLAVLGGLCVLYGLAVLALRSGTLFFAFWLVLGAALLAGAWALHTGAWNAIGPVARRGICAVLCVLAVGFAGTQALVFQNFNDQGEDGLDYLVVLGAQVRADGPSPVLRYRLDTAYDYLQRNPGTRCIVSGSQGFNEPAPEAHVMADYLQARGIAPDRILVEDASTNTAQNMANSAAFFDPASARVGVVTNNFHVYRALRIAHKQGLSHVCGIAAPSLAFWLPNNLARESVSIAKAFALGDM